MQFTYLNSVSDIIKNEISTVKNSMPAKVIKYFPEKQAVSVQPLIHDLTVEGVDLQLPPIDNVPVRFPAADINGLQALISFPIKEGDTVNLIFSMRSLDDWLNGDGGEVVPKSRRRLDLNDCYAEIGACTFKTHLKPDPDNLQIRYAGNIITLHKEGHITIKSPIKVIVDTPIADFTGKIHAKDTITSDVDCISAGISGVGHIHGGVRSGGDTSGVPE